MMDRIGPGTFIAVVGPSGAGKDTILRGARGRFAGRPEIVFPTRIITRPEGDDSEPHLAATDPEFEAMAEEGAFALHWCAHGLRYAIPAAVDAAIGSGAVVVANLSRAAIAAARARYARLIVASISVDPTTLRQRLLCRGRETPRDIDLRLQRMDAHLLKGDDVITIDNSGEPESAIAALCRCVETEL